MTDSWRKFPLQYYLDDATSRIHSRGAMGREKWGETFVGDPLREAEQEVEDLLYYLYVIRRQRDQMEKEGKATWILPFNQFASECYRIAVDKGWHDQERTFGDEVALIHSEVSEALEEYRKTGNAKSPEVVEELADILIRVADVAGKHDIDIEEAVTKKMAKNANRPYRHGGKHL